MPELTLFNCIDAVEGNGAFLFSDTEKLFANSFLVLMKDTPYTKIAVKEITGLSGKSRTMFYHHFSDTLDLMDRIQRLLLENSIFMSCQKARQERKTSPEPTKEWSHGLKRFWLFVRYFASLSAKTVVRISRTASRRKFGRSSIA